MTTERRWTSIGELLVTHRQFKSTESKSIFADNYKHPCPAFHQSSASYLGSDACERKINPTLKDNISIKLEHSIIHEVMPEEPAENADPHGMSKVDFSFFTSAHSSMLTSDR